MITLPLYYAMSDGDVESVIEAVTKIVTFYRKDWEAGQGLKIIIFNRRNGEKHEIIDHSASLQYGGGG